MTELEEYKKAYGDLIKGKSTAQVRTANGKSITYFQGDADALKARINALSRRSRQSRTRLITTRKA